MNNRVVLGIDPGRKGAYAVITDGRLQFSAPLPYAGDELDISRLASAIASFGVDEAILEKVHAMPGQGVVSMFTFGRSYGELRGMIKTQGIPLFEPTPQAWKKIVLAGTDWKGSKAAAVEHVIRRYPAANLYPGRTRKAHDGVADAICLAEYGVLRLGGAANSNPKGADK